jgi:hypothetical protein
MSKDLRQTWSRSKIFRIALVVAVMYTGLRLIVHGVYLAMLLSPDQGVGDGLPEWADAEGPTIPNDLQDYLTAASHLQNRQDLYLKGKLDRVEFYQYAPSYALAFVPFLWLSPTAVVTVHTLLHIAAYGLLYWLWGRIFCQMGLDEAKRVLIWTLPVWLVFSAFWSDLGYLNIYIIMALLSTLLIDAILNERLHWSLLWLSIILQTKPQWAFAVAVPLFLGRYRLFIKLTATAIVAYAAIMGITMLVVGPRYGWGQYVDYIHFLLNMPRNFPWRGPDAPFLGYNHSVTQVVVYLLGASSDTLRLVAMIKVLLLLPLVAVALRHVFRSDGRPARQVPQLGLDLAFVLYLGAFIWLDVVWELSLGIAVFTYLLATSERCAKIYVWAVFLPYALIDFWQLASLGVLGMDVIAPGPYVLTDPSVYIPLVMIVTLAFYALLVRRLWTAAPLRHAAGARG